MQDVFGRGFAGVARPGLSVSSRNLEWDWLQQSVIAPISFDCHLGCQTQLVSYFRRNLGHSEGFSSALWAASV